MWYGRVVRNNVTEFTECEQLRVFSFCHDFFAVPIK